MTAFIVIVSLVVLGFLGIHFFRWPLFNAAVRAQRAKSGLSENAIQVDGHEVVYLDGGSGETLVLIHGFGANKDNWIQVAPMLSPHFRLIIPDLPGFGDSTRDHSASYNVDAQISRLRLFIEALDLNPVHLGGNSMGGYLAAVYSGRYPADVKSQWLLAPAGVAAAEPSELFQYLERGENPLLISDVSDFNRLMSFCFNKTPYIPKSFQRCMCERNMREREFNEKIFSEMFSEPPSLESELTECVTKTQILWGDNDRILHASGAELLAKLIKGAQAIVMPQMGHCPMIESPRETADHYLKFHGIA